MNRSVTEKLFNISLWQVLQIIPETMFGLLARIIQLQISSVKEVGDAYDKISFS